MEINLDSAELRVLGCLMEKEFLTPENYPMTVNYLRTACNQKSSRDPVVEYDDDTVEHALTRLRGRGWVMLRSATGSRALKYEHLLPSFFDLKKKHTAILCVLMLRGPQTLVELKSHTARMYPFENIAQVEETLIELSEKNTPLAVKLERISGQKERRYMHLLSDQSGVSIQPQVRTPEPSMQNRDMPKSAQEPDSKISSDSNLTSRVETLEKELNYLKNDFNKFRKQFES